MPSEQELKMIVAEAINRASARLGGQLELAKAMGTGVSVVSRWKNGHVDRFELDLLIALFNEAEMPMTRLQGWPDPESSGLSPEQAEQLAEIHARVMGADALTLHRADDHTGPPPAEDKSVSKHKPPQGKKPVGQPRRKAE
ncbi:hypothetical protein IT575_12020 [bacterium]|nr:hypothetical protein [bacterium]